jgi:DNA-binding transcriptional LysR family regulator
MSDLRKIDLNLLVALEAVLEERNLTRAAERVGMTQPAMSGALARLRKVIGDDLLIRVGRGYVLSPVGGELLPTVREAMAQVQRTLGASRAFDPATSTRRFTISVSDYALFVIGTRLERRLAEIAPGVEVAFDHIPPPDELGTHLLRRDLIIGGAKRGIPGQRRAIFRDRYVCVVSDADTPLRGNRASQEELEALPYLSGWFGEEVKTHVDDGLAEAGIQVRCVQTAPGLLALPFLVPGTQMFAFVPERLVKHTAAQLRLRIVDTPVEVPPLVEAAHWHPLNAEEAGLRWLLDVLGEIGQELREEPAPEPSSA